MKRALMVLLAVMMALMMCSCSIVDKVKGLLPEQLTQLAGIGTKENEPPENTPAPDAPQPDAPAEPADVQREDSLLGNTSGNLLSGSMAMDESTGTLYVARDGGVYAVREGQSTRLDSAKASRLNLYDGMLYYVEQIGETWDTGGATENLYALDLATGVRYELLWDVSLRTEHDYRYNYDDMSRNRYTNYPGICDMTVWNGYIYYIGTMEGGGAKSVYNMYAQGTTLTTYEAEQAIWRMPVEGGEKQLIVAELGNGDPHFCIDGDGRIYYTKSFANGYSAYPVTAFFSCAPDGSDQRNICGMADAGSADAIRENVKGLMVQDGQLLVLAYDSEGDFPHARIMQASYGGYDFLMDAAYHVNPTNAPDEGIIAFDTNGETEYVVEDGVYMEEYLESPQIIHMQVNGSAADYDVLYEFGRLARYGETFSSFDMACFGETVYLLTADGVYALDMQTRQMARLAAQ